MGQSTAHPHPHIPEGSTLYDFSVKDANGNVVSLEKFRTIPTVLIVKIKDEGIGKQHRQLQTLHDRYKDHGFAVLAFPTADALSSELHDADSLEKHGESRKVNFPLFGRVTPSGHNEHPLFQWLHVGVSDTSYPPDAEMEFTRFLVVSGQPWKRYTAEDSMNKIEADVAHALHKMNDANSAHGVNVKLHDCSSQTG